MGSKIVGADWLRPTKLMCQGRNLGASALYTAQPEHLLGLSFCPLSLWHNDNFLAASYIRMPEMMKRLCHNLPK